MNISHSIKKRINILLVDDHPENLNLLSSLLSDYGYQIRRAISGKMALKAVEADDFDLILLDVCMPEMDGYEVCSRLKSNLKTAQIPIIFISALDATLDKVKAFNVGGADYITKPFEIEEVRIRIDNQVKLIKLQQQNKQINDQLEEKIAYQTRELQLTNKKLIQSQQNLLKNNLKDPVTHLNNRFYLLGQLRQTCRMMMQENSNFCFSLLVLKCSCSNTVDKFVDLKLADLMAISLAERLAKNTPPASSLTRLEGNEFIIILKKVAVLEESTKIAEQLCKKLSLPFAIDDLELVFQVDYGVVLVDQHYDTPEAIVRKARKLAFISSQKYRDRQILKSTTNHNHTNFYSNIDSTLKHALERQDLNLVYQPIISLQQKILCRGDIFVSWTDRGVKNIVSGQLFAAIQNQELSLAILNSILKQACQDLNNWQEIILWTDESQDAADENIGINFKLFGEQLFLPNLSENFKQIVQQSGVSSQNISLEISGSLIENNFTLAIKKIQEFKSLGFLITIDDVNIRKFPSDCYCNFDNLNLDCPSVVKTNQTKQQWARIAQKVALARDAKMTVTAVNIKKLEQLKLMKKSGCEFAQGEFIHKPVPAKTIETLIIKNPGYGI